MKTFNLFLFLLFICLLSNAQNDWTKITQQPTKGVMSSQMAKEGEHVLLGTQEGIFRSTDNGQTWSKVNEELTFYSENPGGVMELGGDTAWASDGTTNAYSFDGGQTWNTVSAPDSLNEYYSRHSQFVEGFRFYMSFAEQQEEFLFYTDDFGQTWHQDTSYSRNDFIHMNLNHEWLFRYNAAADQLRFTEDGSQFHQLPSPPVSLSLEASIKGDTSDLYLGNMDHVLKYNSSNETWDPIATNVPGDGNDLLVNAKGDTVVIARFNFNTSNVQGFISTNAGDDWQAFDMAQFGYPATTIIFDNRAMWAPTMKGLYKSEDLGASWSAESGNIYKRGMIPQSLNENMVISSLFDLYEYSPSGESFTNFPLSDSMAAFTYSVIRHSPEALYLRNDQLFGSSTRRLFYKNSESSEWKESNSPDGVLSSQFFIHNEFIATSVQTGGIYFSNDYGQNWDSLALSFDIFSLSGITGYDNRVILALEKQESGEPPSEGIYYSEDEGTNWAPLENGSLGILDRINVSDLVGLGDGFLVIPSGQPIIDSTYIYNEGWASYSTGGVKIQQPIRQVRKKNGNIYLLNDSAVFVSKDEGRNWEVEQVLPKPGIIQGQTFAFSKEKMVLGTNEGLYQTDYTTSTEPQPEAKSQKFEVFPNPVSGNQVHLKYANSTPANPKTMSGTIYNNQGQSIKQFEWKTGAKGKQKALELPEGLKSGIYHIRIQAGDKVHSNSFVKQ